MYTHTHKHMHAYAHTDTHMHDTHTYVTRFVVVHLSLSLQAGQEGEEAEQCVSVGDPVSVVCVNQTSGHVVAGAHSTLRHVHPKHSSTLLLYTYVCHSPLCVCLLAHSVGCITTTWSCYRSAEVTQTPSEPSSTFQTESR